MIGINCVKCARREKQCLGIIFQLGCFYKQNNKQKQEQKKTFPCLQTVCTSPLPLLPSGAAIPSSKVVQVMHTWRKPRKLWEDSSSFLELHKPKGYAMCKISIINKSCICSSVVEKEQGAVTSSCAVHVAGAVSASLCHALPVQSPAQTFLRCLYQVCVLERLIRGPREFWILVVNVTRKFKYNL